jgi:large subunit ribosomal protein L4
MPNVKVYSMQGKETGEIELNASVFGIEPNKTVLHDVIVNFLANQRQGTQSTLTRAEVSGGGRKPWRQKGTGHARQGSTRSPQWTHGGVALGPKPRDYSYRLNRKVKRLAVKSALSSKVKDNDIIVVDNIALEGYKTKEVAAMLSALEAGKKPLIVTAASDDKVVKSARNIPGVSIAQAGSLSVYEILNCGKFIIAKDAVEKLTEVYKDE